MSIGTLNVTEAIPAWKTVLGIAELAYKIIQVWKESASNKKRGLSINLSTAYFVPKPFTPFQWAKMCREEDYTQKARIVKSEIRSRLNQKSIHYSWHEPDVTILEGVLARGDRRLGPAILRAYKKGALFDAWSEMFRFDLWKEAFAETGVDPDFYTLRERPDDEIFPWDFIDCGVTKEFLKQEWLKAQSEITSPNCKLKCQGCGAARFFYLFFTERNCAARLKMQAVSVTIWIGV